MSDWRDITLPNSPLRRSFKFNASDNSYTIRTDQPNLVDCLSLNKAFLNSDRNSSSLWNGGDYVKVASIPLEVIEKWHKEEGINFYRANDEDKARLLNKLNDSTYNKFRTAKGVL